MYRFSLLRRHGVAVFTYIFTLSLIACGGGGGGGGTVARPPADPAPQPASSGQALLGPVVDADVALYRVGRYDAAICTTQTSGGDVLEEAGLIRFDDSCLAADGLYLVVISGGEDIDADDDGVLDDTPTPLAGELHALVSAEQIRGRGWKVNALTEAMYDNVRHLLGGQYEEQRILAALDAMAARTVRSDLNDDDSVDYADVVNWSPRMAGDTLRLPPAQVARLRDDALAGGSQAGLARTLLGDWDLVYETEGASLPLVAGDRAVTCGPSGVEIIDVSYPGAPVALGYHALGEERGVSPGPCLAASENVIYRIDQDTATLFIIDISNPDNIAETVFQLADAPVQAFSDGEVLYLITTAAPDAVEYTLLTYDITDPFAPQFLNSTALPALVTDISASLDQRIWITLLSGQLWEIGRDSEGLPVVTASFETGDAGLGTGFGVAAAGDRLYLAARPDFDRTLLTVFDVSEPGNLMMLGEPRGFEFVSFGLESYDDELYAVKISDAGPEPAYDVLRFSLREPDQPELVGSFTLGPAAYFTVSNGVLYSTQSGSGLRIRSLEPTDAGELGFLATSDWAFSSAISGDVALLAARDAGLLSVDVSDRSRPRLMSSLVLDEPYYASGLALNGDLAVLGVSDTAEDPHAVLVDVSDPASLEVVSTIAFPADALLQGADLRDAVIEDDIAYLALDEGGLMAVDISDPAVPVVLSELPIAAGREEASGLAIAGDRLLLLDENVGFDLFEVADPGIPLLLGSYSSAFNTDEQVDWAPFAAVTDGGMAYVVQGRYNYGAILEGEGPYSFGQLEVVDISDPADPTSVSTLATSGHANEITLAGTVAYVSDREGVVDVVDMTDPVSPQVLHTIPVPAAVGDVVSDESYIYVSTELGLFIYPQLRLFDIP